VCPKVGSNPNLAQQGLALNDLTTRAHFNFYKNIFSLSDGAPNPQLLEMMKDPFANYVVQKMLDVSDSAHRKKIMFSIKSHIPALRKFNYGKHIIG